MAQRGNIKTPYTAEIEVGGVVTQMFTEQTDLNCASCHTESASYGRIFVP